MKQTQAATKRSSSRAARLGVLPHTVQHYGLDDPAPTYGNDGFAHVRDFIHQEAGRRRVLWLPETAYWVSFDIDIPLFFPLHAERSSRSRAMGTTQVTEIVTDAALVQRELLIFGRALLVARRMQGGRGAVFAVLLNIINPADVARGEGGTTGRRALDSRSDGRQRLRRFDGVSR